MIRGRIDLLFPHKTGIAIVDYKTDNVCPADARSIQRLTPARCAFTAANRADRRAKITTSFLVFLSARAVEEIKLD